MLSDHDTGRVSRKSRLLSDVELATSGLITNPESGNRQSAKLGPATAGSTQSESSPYCRSQVSPKFCFKGSFARP